ncbi:ArsR/SmtB family transcription factor [Streptomyces phaeochromogenes]|uniref:ArsR/SmtB family transcription factor n=1 Tax=Streptomyces phaeochromogenes TaxID=1923 RepID=UPI003866B15A|nr:ArsR family transcriptional regulator [Streptomyces phaeochromogenes]
MLRIHFTDADLARTRMATAPDALWEVAASLHRFQTRAGRWAYAEWYRTTHARLRERQLDRVVREVLLPLFPRARYFPDFLTPSRPNCAGQGLDAGLDAIMSTPADRVSHELALLDRTVGAPAWVRRLTGTQERRDLVAAIRAYHGVAVRPFADQIHAHLEAKRSSSCRHLLDGGVQGMLAGLGPTMSWEPPVLHVRYAADRDLHLGGRGIRLVPSYFCWDNPVSLADPQLPPVLFYPLLHEPAAAALTTPLTALLGRTRATVLRVAASGAGATTGEIARAAGISPSSVSKHAGVLRGAGLLISSRHGGNVLHTLTPAGASMLRADARASTAAPRPAATATAATAAAAAAAAAR